MSDDVRAELNALRWTVERLESELERVRFALEAELRRLRTDLEAELERVRSRVELEQDNAELWRVNTNLARAATRAEAAVAAFAADMRARGIHIGIGATGAARCVTCAEPWPCASSGEVLL